MKIKYLFCVWQCQIEKVMGMNIREHVLSTIKKSTQEMLWSCFEGWALNIKWTQQRSLNKRRKETGIKGKGFNTKNQAGVILWKKAIMDRSRIKDTGRGIEGEDKSFHRETSSVFRYIF